MIITDVAEDLAATEMRAPTFWADDYLGAVAVPAATPHRVPLPLTSCASSASTTKTKGIGIV